MIERIAKIEKTMLGFEDHGIFTAYLMVNYGGSGQGLGGYAMSRSARADGERTVKGSSTGIDFIIGVLGACGVETWEGVKGRTIIVLFESDDWSARPVGIKPLPTESGKPFMFNEWCARTKETEQ